MDFHSVFQAIDQKRIKSPATYHFDFTSSTISLLVAALNDRVGLLLDRRKFLLVDGNMDIDRVFSPGQFYGYDIAVLNHCHDVDYQEVLRYNEEHANDPEGGAADEK